MGCVGRWGPVLLHPHAQQWVALQTQVTQPSDVHLATVMSSPAEGQCHWKQHWRLCDAQGNSRRTRPSVCHSKVASQRRGLRTDEPAVKLQPRTPSNLLRPRECRGLTARLQLGSWEGVCDLRQQAGDVHCLLCKIYRLSCLAFWGLRVTPLASTTWGQPQCITGIAGRFTAHLDVDSVHRWIRANV